MKRAVDRLKTEFPLTVHVRLYYFSPEVGVCAMHLFREKSITFSPHPFISEQMQDCKTFSV